MKKEKFIELPKNEDVLLTTLELKFKEAGYKLTAHRESQKRKEINDSPFRITPINADDSWCFNVCKSERY